MGFSKFDASKLALKNEAFKVPELADAAGLDVLYILEIPIGSAKAVREQLKKLPKDDPDVQEDFLSWQYVVLSVHEKDEAGNFIPYFDVNDQDQAQLLLPPETYRRMVNTAFSFNNAGQSTLLGDVHEDLKNCLERINKLKEITGSEINVIGLVGLIDTIGAEVDAMSEKDKQDEALEELKNGSTQVDS